MKGVTFIQVAAAGIIVIVLGFLLTVFCIDGTQRGAVTTAFISLLSLVAGYMFHAAQTEAQQKQASDTNSQLIDALQNSIPTTSAETISTPATINTSTTKN